MSALPAWMSQLQEITSGAAVPAWLAAVRQQAIERFQREGWPTTRREQWRHTSLTLLQQQSFRAVVSQAGEAERTFAMALVEQLGLHPDSECLVFFDGRLAWHRPGAQSGQVQIRPLAVALEEDDAALEALYGRADEGEVVAALNLALAANGVCIRVPEGLEMRRPVHLIHLTSTPQAAAFLRNVVVAEPGSRLDIVEHYLGAEAMADGSGYRLRNALPAGQAVQETAASTGSFTNAVTRVHVAEGARVAHARLQQEPHDAFHYSALYVVQARRSQFASHSLSFGARLARHDIVDQMDGTHCESLLNGLYYVDGKRHIDHHTLIDHAQPNGTSREYYRGILDDMARGVFTGRIVVARGSDGTDAGQRSDSLLLSRRARSDARPELEIYADDVKCSHGATVGQIDGDALFYLRSRGIDGDHARSLLTYAFASSVLQRIDIPVVRQLGSQAIRKLLPAGGQMLEEFNYDHE